MTTSPARPARATRRRSTTSASRCGSSSGRPTPSARRRVTTAATGNVAADLPRNVGAPGIAGTAKRTLTLTASAGSWTPAGATFAYQWQRDDGDGFTDISGATAASYVLVTADVEATVRVEVTATNVDGSTAAVSAPTATVVAATPGNRLAPALTGGSRVGDTLASTDGAWSPAAESFAYQWQRRAGGGTYTDISGATANTYTLVAADAGATVRLKVTATNDDGTGLGYSAATATVVAPPDAAERHRRADRHVAGHRDAVDRPRPVDARRRDVHLPVAALPVGRDGARRLRDRRLRPELHLERQRRRPRDGGARDRHGRRRLDGGDLDLDQRRRRPGADADQRAHDPGHRAGRPDGPRAARGLDVPTRSEKYQWRRCDADGADCADIPGAGCRPTRSPSPTRTTRWSSTRPRPRRAGARRPSAPPRRSPISRCRSPRILPAISGTPARAANLQATRGSLGQRSDALRLRLDALRQRRRSNCAAIPGATRTNYVLQAADVGSTVTVAVTAAQHRGLDGRRRRRRPRSSRPCSRRW